MTKIKNYKLVLLCAFILAVFGLFISFSVFEIANATDEQTTDTQTNSPINISFDYEIDDPSIVPDYTFYELSLRREYTYKTPITIGGPADVEYENNGGEYTIKFYVSEQENWTFTYYSPIGYDPELILPATPISHITTDTVFKVKFNRYYGNYTLSVHIDSAANSNSVNGPVENYSIKYYDKSYNELYSTTTDASGNCSFTLPSSQGEGIIIGEKDGFSDTYKPIDSHSYDINHEYSFEMALVDIEKCNFRLSSNDSQHQFFEWRADVYLIPSPTPETSQLMFHKKNITYGIDSSLFGGEAHIEADGTIVIEKTVMSSVKIVHTIVPSYNEGSSVDYWNINKGDGNVVQYKCGETFTLQDTDKLIGDVVYKQLTPPGPEPSPDPVPEPTPENIDSTVQTGDATAVAVITLLIIASLSAGFILRKSYK